jgi:hypothetical protein
MTNMESNIAGCRCGQVKLEVLGEPIVSTVCHCSSCQKAGRLLEDLPGASHILDETGGTPFVLFRKDRLRCAHGAAFLAEHRLKADSPTRRIVATCCNTAMFLDFTKGHWISIYRERLALDQATVKRKSGLFTLRLVIAWAKMAFRTPKIDFVKGRIDAVEN